MCLGLLLLGANAFTAEAQPARPAVSIWNYAHMLEVRASLKKGEPTYAKAYASLLKEADTLLKGHNASVMDKPDTRMAKNGDKHDFYSVGKYCWPNPNTPDGLPWIQRDGYINHDNFRLDDSVRQDKMCARVSKLARAYFFSGEERYAAKAVEATRVWFLDPATRMNPNLNFAQVIPGNDQEAGHVPGVIFGRIYVELLAGLSLLQHAPAYTPEFDAGIKKWFADYDHWLTTSTFGQKEDKSPNNHSIAYDQQRLAFALYAGDEATARKLVQDFHPRRIFHQVQPDGKMPRELARTLGMHYSAFNVIHMLEICEMAANISPNLYQVKSPDGRCIGISVDYIAGFLGKTVKDFEPYKQISDWDSCQTKLCWIVKWADRWDKSKNYAALYQKHATPKMAEHINQLLY